MKTALDEMYIVLKIPDVPLALTGEERLALEDMLDKIRQFRVRNLRPPYRKYVVVSDVFECYGDVERMVLEELNESE